MKIQARRSFSERDGGFTLLEVMVALGILAVSLTWMVEATTRAVSVENHAKLISTATFLARGRLVELEDELADKGFTDDSFAKETGGDFEDKGFKRFKWFTVIDKIELPNTDQVQTMMTQGLEAQQGALGAISGTPPTPPASGAPPGMPPMSGGAGMLGSQFGLIKDVLEQSIRRARVRITWSEGQNEKSIEIVEYLTDPRRVDQSVQMGGMLGAAGAAGAGGAPGAGGAAAGSAAGGSVTGGGATSVMPQAGGTAVGPR